MGRKVKAGEEAKRKKKAHKRKALREAQKLKDNPYYFDESKFLDADDEFFNPAQHEMEGYGMDPDLYYMMASVGHSKLSEDGLRQLHEINFDRYQYFYKYLMFEEEWEELKQKYPSQYKGQYPPELKPSKGVDVDKILAEGTAALKSGNMMSWIHKGVFREPPINELDAKSEAYKELPTATRDGVNAGGYPHNELDAKPEYNTKESPTAASDSVWSFVSAQDCERPTFITVG